MSERAFFARRGYEAGRRAERHATADRFSGFAGGVADLVALAYLDGRADAGDDFTEFDEARATRVRQVHDSAEYAFRVLGYTWQRDSR